MYQTSIFTRPPAPQPQKKRLIRYVLWNAFKRMLMAIGALVLFSAIAASFLLSRVLREEGAIPAPLPAKTVLYLPLDGDWPEYTKMVMPYGFARPELTLRGMIDALDRAAGDGRVKGLVADLRGGMTDIAQIQELRAALLRFRAAGKFAYIYGSSYGEPGRGLGTYYLASTFDQIWLQPMGEVSIAGIGAEMPFARAVLDKIGVQPQFFARKEYKTLFESFTGTEMSPQSREMMQGLIDDLAGQFVQGIAEARKMDAAAVKALVDRGLFSDRQALDAGLADKLEDYEALREKVSMDVTGKPDPEDGLFTGIDDYAADTMPPPSKGPAVALVHIKGAIMPSGAPEDGFVAAEDISDDISDAADDKDTKAIVVRIDSPGGSPAASETIRRALVRAKAKGKKVIVSMGGMAASGGYWVASPADRIFALPGTLTGSIGVAGGKFALQGLWDKIGITWDGVQYGKNADLMSFNKPFSQDGAALMNDTMDAIYEGFTARVAEGRKMTPAQVDKVARGRVWSGRQAAANGLVDEIGGLDAALDYTAKQLGAAKRQELDIYTLPRPVTPIERIRELIGNRVGLKDDLKVLMNEYHAARYAGEMTVWMPLSVR